MTILDVYPHIYNNVRDTILQRIVETQEVQMIEHEKINFHAVFQKTEPISIKNLKIKLRQRKLLDNRYLTLYRLQNHTQKQKFVWVFDPKCPLRQYWDYLIIVVAFYINFTYPYYIIFVKSYPVWFTFLSNFIDLILVLDIVIILTTAIIEKNQKIDTFMTITQKRVIQIGFYLDFFSCIKTELLFWIWTTNKRYSDVLKLNRVLKIYRIPKFIRKFENDINLNFPRLIFFKYTFYLIIVTYWFGGLLFLTTCLENSCTEDGWFLTKHKTDIKQDRNKSYTSDFLLTSVYFSLSCLTGYTSGDILPINTTDRLFTCFGFILGFFTFCCCVAQLAAASARKSKVRLDFQDKFHSILNFMKERKISSDVVKRVRNYFTLQWHYNKASIFKEQHLLYNINKNIQAELQIKEKLDIILRVPVFQHLDQNFLVQLVTKAETLVLPPEEYITYKGECLKILYVIMKGYCIRQFGKNI